MSAREFLKIQTLISNDPRFASAQVEYVPDRAACLSHTRITIGDRVETFYILAHFYDFLISFRPA
jgi:hypothetical protein